MRQSWRQQNWRHCKIFGPSARRHCLVMSLDSIQMLLHTKPYGYRRAFPLVVSLTSDDDGPLVDHDRPGDPRSGATLECHLVTTGTPDPPWPQWRDAASTRASRWWWWWWSVVCTHRGSVQTVRMRVHVHMWLVAAWCRGRVRRSVVQRSTTQPVHKPHRTLIIANLTRHCARSRCRMHESTTRDTVLRHTGDDSNTNASAKCHFGRPQVLI